MKYILGIDDAGRGPIIGPMVVSGVLIKREDTPTLKTMGIKDSKLIIPSKREYLADQIKKVAQSYKIVKITALEIDTREEKGLNLNDLEAMKMAEAANYLTKDLSNKEDSVDVIVDCPSVNTQTWGAKFAEFINPKKLSMMRLVIEHKADFNYPACAAASILSKVKRDQEISKIKEDLRVDFGSGYPADPKTVKFLKERGKKYLKYHIIRETWQTWKNLMAKSDQKQLF